MLTNVRRRRSAMRRQTKNDVTNERDSSVNDISPNLNEIEDLRGGRFLMTSRVKRGFKTKGNIIFKKTSFEVHFIENIFAEN
jgi:hypothetical protein